MTVGDLRPLVLVLAIACHRTNDFGALPRPGPGGLIEAPVPDYPFGDAVDVYRAALDLLYVDGDERPSIIVMLDSVRLIPGGVCQNCPMVWPGKSNVDTSTLNALWTRPRAEPRIRDFGYKIPIHFMSFREQTEIWNAGQAYDSIHPPLPGKQGEGPDGEFRRRYPGAWGTATFSLVGFNRIHSEALLELRHLCGSGCNSGEIVFFRKVKGEWVPIERLTRDVSAVGTYTRRYYRGPVGKKPGDSQMLVDQAGIPLRSEGKYGPAVYRAVIDSLYSFYGQRPRMIVMSDQHTIASDGLLPDNHQIDSMTRAAFRFLSSIGDRMQSSFSYRMPFAVLTSDSMQALDREGIPLQRESVFRVGNEETTPFWLAFRKHYPGAWGYVELSRIGFNPEHTQALVSATHHCGQQCMSSDVWFLTRTGEVWSVVEKLPGYVEAGWLLDSLRYIGRDANPKNYGPRRARGIVTSFETGAILPFLDVTFYSSGDFRKTVTTDSAGRYAVERLPLYSEVFFRVRCPPIPGRSDTVAGPYLMSHPGIDTTVNVHVQFRGCAHLNRRHPLIAGATKTSTQSDPRRLSPELAGVYRGVLDVLYPPSDPGRGTIMLEGFTTRPCWDCIESEVPRLFRKGLIDPSTVANFEKVRPDTSAPPVFSYRRRIEVMPLWDSYWLGTSAHRQWDAMKDAYPGVNAVISFAAVAFNDRRTQALVEFHADSAGSEDDSEIMLLKKTGQDWRVVLRHVEREATSGEWSGGKCEAGDAPAQPPSRAEIERIAGVFSLVRTVRVLEESKGFINRTDTVQVRLDPLKSVPGKPNELVATANVLGPTGEPNKKVAVKFHLDQDAATITFTDWLPEGQYMFDGWTEEHKILRLAEGGFVGSWFTVNGPTIPWRGYFCARPVSARSP